MYTSYYKNEKITIKIKSNKIIVYKYEKGESRWEAEFQGMMNLKILN